MSVFNSIQKQVSKLKFVVGHTKFIHAIILFLCAYILRLIPEFMVGKYPIGNDTITFYAPYIAKYRFDLLNMFYWGHLTSWLFLKFNYALAGDNPFFALKIVGPELYGFLIVSFYEFLTSFKWSHKKSFLISLMLLVQVPMLRLSWDLYHNVLGLSFMFFTLSELNKIIRSRESEKSVYMKFAFFFILTALTHQMTTFILFSITMLLILKNLFTKDSHLKIKNLIRSMLPALSVFALAIILPRFITNNANPFQISYKEVMMEEAGTYFLVNNLDFMSYPELLSRISLTFIVAYAPLIPLIIIGYRHEELTPVLRYYLIILLLCTFSPLVIGISLFHWDRWMWLLIFPFSIYVFKGMSVIDQKISKLNFSGFFKKIFRTVFILAVAFSFLFLSFVYTTYPLSNAFILYDSFPSKWYLPETLQKTSIPFELIPDLENCARWLDENIKGYSVVLFETPYSGFVLLKMTPKDNVTLLSYYYTEFDTAFQESLQHDFDYTYFIWPTNYALSSNNPNVNFFKIYTSGNLSVYVRPRDFKPPFLTADTNLLRFKNGTYVQVLNDSKLSPPVFTIEFWAKPIFFKEWARWMGKSIFTSDRKEGWEIMWTDNFISSTMRLAMWDKNGVEKISESVTAPLSQWTHIAFTFNGTHIISYQNGNLNGVTEVGDWKPLPSEESLRIGKASDNSYYDGYLADLRLYNRSLSSFEIAHNILGEVTQDRLILDYDFINRGSTTMPDLSGEGNNGTIIIH